MCRLELHAERVGHAVPAPLLQQRQPRRLHPLHQRPGPAAGRHRRHPPGAERQQGPGQLPQPVPVQPVRQEGRRAADPDQRGGRPG